MLAVRKMHTLSYFVCILILFLSISAEAEDVGAKFTTFAGFELGTVTLEDVQRKLGEQGDALVPTSP
jgi:predicted secreted Zn-dependent protease